MLKKVIIQGFKSFAEKTEITLDPSITGIVGPNGSGKSNVAEAIRWALGETKNKIMRFERQQDVIFSGSQGKKPVGMAEVTLVIDNGQKYFPLPYEEIAITRRCFRSGESEFFINKSSCRLKDIHELLVDTGLGKNGYAIIGQGQVDELLFSSPEEKRSYLEEAAGINRFRLREHEAKKKLSETQNSIIRLEDLSRELEGELLSKEEQVRKATKYLAIKEELTKKAKKFYGNKIKNLEEKIIQNDEKIKQVNCLLESTQTKILKNELFQHELTLKEQELLKNQEAAHEIVTTLENCLEKLKNAKFYQEAEEERLKQEIYNLKNLIKNNGFKLLEIKNELLEYQNKLNVLMEKEKEINIHLKNQQQILGIEENNLNELKQKLEALKDELFDLNFKEVSLKNELNFLTENHERIITENKKLKQEIEKIDIEEIKIKSQLTQAFQDSNENKIKLENIIKKIEDYQKKLTLIKKEISILQNEKIILEKKYHETFARIQALNKLEESYEGYGKEIKNFFEQKRKNLIPNSENIIGTVGEYIEVGENYRIAIETALGASIKNIIVKKAQNLEKTINYLKEKKLGRITFIALDILSGEQGRLENADDIKIDGYIGRAINLVSFPENLRKVYENLLSKVLVGKDYQAALKISKITNYKYKVVSLEGELLLPGGVIIGGSTNYQFSVLQRKNEIKELNKLKEDLEGKNNLAAETIAKLQNVQENLSLDIVSLEELKKNTEGELRELSFSIEKLQEKLNELSKMKLELNKQIVLNNDEIKNLQIQREKRIQDLEVIETKKRNSQDNIKKLEEQITSKDELILKNQNHFQFLSLQRVQIEKEIENIKNLSDEKIKQKKEYFARHIVNIRNIFELKQKILNIKHLKITLDEKIEKHLEIIEKAASYYQEIKVEYDKIKTNLLEIQSDLSELQKTSQRNFNEMTRLEAKQRHYLEEINSLKLLISEKYGIVLGDKETNNYDDDEEIDEKQLQVLFEQLSVLEPVNVYIIDEYKRLEERIKFLKQQHEDLLLAKNQLEKLLNQLNEEIEQKFNDFLAVLNLEYDAVFKELFGGGFASITKILEPNRQGVEIIVELPGKKQQPLGLLSGGERALATIALLFALFNLKPSPFCVLDEIDAALDEVNVQRFSVYLEKIGKRNQILIITHRRGSMEVCNKLIGVSMQEGSSKILSISLHGIKAG